MDYSSPYFLVWCLTYCTLIVLSNRLKGKAVRDAKPDEFPYIVAIGDNTSWNENFCTGTLISGWSVLTTAHCFLKTKTSNIRITIGSRNFSLGKKYTVKEVTTYDQWATGTKEIELSSNDIAVVTLNKRVKCLTAPILTFALEDLYNSKVRIAGWGLVEDGTKPAILKTAVMSVESNEACSKHLTVIFNDTTDVPKTHFCTVADPSVIASCGDSGAPIFNKQNQVVGIHSGTCPDDYYPPKYIRNVNLHLHQYRDFIRDVMK